MGDERNCLDQYLKEYQDVIIHIVTESSSIEYLRAVYTFVVTYPDASRED
ncbi:MAG: hypothetical protein NC417_11225 [Candidatus Gastranaerophilales bacterium]|nr:hypothetical protein [Candidatus Gastranaerophilales bacterium]